MEEEAIAFYYCVYDTIRNIPPGKVTSYAMLNGRPRNARQIGTALRHLPTRPAESREYDYHIDNVPWWRVIGSQGKIAIRSNPNARVHQMEALQQEGIEVNAETFSVNLNLYGWFPTIDEYEREFVDG